MAVEIQTVSDRKVLVNNKLVYLDQNEDWIAKIELTNSETEALNTHLSTHLKT